MNRVAQLAELRQVVKDTATPYLWSDDTLIGYLAEGQDKFCEDTGYFVDLTNFTVTLQTNVYVYAIPARVIQVLDIFNGRTKLGKSNPDDVSVIGPDWVFDTDEPGMPTHWRTDRATGYIEFNRTPTAEQNGTVLTLQVWRYSQYSLDHQTAGVYDKDPELPSRFQRACIEWAAYKAFNHHDADAQDPVKSDVHLGWYRQYVREGKLSLQRLQNMETRVGVSPAYRT
jgi:hypothetical protein